MPLTHCKRLLIPALAVLLISGCAGGSGSAGGPTIAEAGNPDDRVTPPEVRLLVYGMSCPLCATNVDAQLGSIPGVTGVETNLGDGWISVRVSDANPPTRRELIEAVEFSGFTFKGFGDTQ